MQQKNEVTIVFGFFTRQKQDFVKNIQKKHAKLIFSKNKSEVAANTSGHRLVE